MQKLNYYQIKYRYRAFIFLEKLKNRNKSSETFSKMCKKKIYHIFLYRLSISSVFLFMNIFCLSLITHTSSKF